MVVIVFLAQILQKNYFESLPLFKMYLDSLWKLWYG